MSRLTQAAAFEDVSLYECDADVATSKATLEKAIKNTAFVNDILTGDNSPPAGKTINHIGKSGSDWRGSLLGVPMMNQAFFSSSAKFDAATPQGVVILAAFPVFIPTGETTIQIDIALMQKHYNPIQVRLLDTSHSVVFDYGTSYNGRGWYSTSLVAGLTAGVRHVMIYTSVEDVATGNFIRHIRVHHARMASPQQWATIFDHSAGAGNTHTVPTTTASGATVMSLTDIDSALVADEMPIHAYLTSRTNRNQNALEEYLTGSPAATNSAVTLADSGATNPTQSAFHDHSKAGKTNEPEVDFPAWAESFGACGINGDVVAIDWTAPGIKSATAGTLYKPQIYLPDFQTGTPRLKCEVLVARPDATAWDAAYEVTASVQCDALGAHTATVSQIGTTAFGRANITGIVHTPDARNSIDLSFTAVALKNVDGTDMLILGACLYFEV